MGDSEFHQKKPSLRVRLSANYLGYKLLVVLGFTLLLAAFIHFREAKIDNLEVGDLAPRFLISQVDFAFPDSESTLLIKQDAIREIGHIYKINERQIVDTRFAFENYVIKARQAGNIPENLQFDALYKATDAFEDVLMESRFTDIRTLQKLEEFHIPTTYFQSYVPKEISQPIYIPESIWQGMYENTSRLDHFSSEVLIYVMNFFKERAWEIEEDRNLVAEARLIAQKSIPDKLTRVRAGTKIVDQGEKVTSRHIAMLQAMKKQLNENRMLWDPLPILSSLILACLFVCLSAWYLYLYKKDVVESFQKLSLLIFIVGAMLLFAKLTEMVILGNSLEYFNLMRYPVILPFATILIVIFLSADVALFASSFLAVILSIGLVVEHTLFLLLNLVAALVVVVTARSLRKRKEVFFVSGKIYISVIPLLIAFSFSENRLWSPSLTADLGFTLLFIASSAILVVGILPVLETVFKVMTEMSLMEYMDPNNELIRRLAMEIPGTYQHCLVLGNLAESMAQSIGADGLFCRVATLYHDIGKLNNPQFFTENQPLGVNIHQLLTPKESAEVIISHVKDGEAIAKKYRLPPSFIDIIKEHHGTNLTYYFYHKELELKAGHEEEVEESYFRYPGPKPHSKESAIIMIADTIEAASRSLEEFNEETITKLVDKLVKARVDEEQFSDCELTFEELGKVKKALIKTLLLTHHIRIKYPEKKETPPDKT